MTTFILAMKHTASNETPAIIKTDWDNLPLGENLSHLCGGRNKHPRTSTDIVEDMKDEQKMFRAFTASELLGDVNIG